MKTRHTAHVWRIAIVFVCGFLMFVVVRAAFVPKDFGKLGFYRPGALADIAALPTHYAGQDQCVVCHTTEAEQRATGKHAGVHCEACHGPLAAHVAGDLAKPPLPSGRICVTCHLAGRGRPAAFPQVDSDHGGDGPCTACHTPHAPKIGLP